MRMTLWIFLVMLVLGQKAWCATYYVDFDKGDDAQKGTSEPAAWKHAPGDPSATGAAHALTLAAGDVVLFKGGVTYRGSIAIPASGEPGHPITYKGDGWGQDKAIIDGAASFGA